MHPASAAIDHRHVIDDGVADPPPVTAIDESETWIPVCGNDAVRVRFYLKAQTTTQAKTQAKSQQFERSARATRGMPAVLHFHGGTFACGTLDEGRTVSRLLAQAGAIVMSVAYPLAPERPFPTAVEVGYDALLWWHRKRVHVAGRGARLYLAGEEAGGNLAVALALIARDRNGPALGGQILLSPMLDPCSGTSSLRAAAGGACGCPWARGWQAYLHSPNDTTHPYAVPAASLRLARLSPTLIIVGQVDAMRDEGLQFAARLKDAGVSVDCLELMNRGWPAARVAPEVIDRHCSATVLARLKAFFAVAGQLPG